MRPSREDVVDEVGRLVQRLGGVVVGLSGEPDVVFGQHLVAQVGDGDPNVTAADVDAEREPGRAGEPDDRGRPSAHRTGGGAGLFGDQSRARQVGEPGDDRRPGQSGQRDQFATGTRTVRPQRLRDPAGVAGQPPVPQRARVDAFGSHGANRPAPYPVMSRVANSHVPIVMMVNERALTHSQGCGQVTR